MSFGLNNNPVFYKNHFRTELILLMLVVSVINHSNK